MKPSALEEEVLALKAQLQAAADENHALKAEISQLTGQLEVVRAACRFQERKLEAEAADYMALSQLLNGEILDLRRKLDAASEALSPERHTTFRNLARRILVDGGLLFQSARRAPTLLLKRLRRTL